MLLSCFLKEIRNNIEIDMCLLRGFRGLFFELAGADRKTLFANELNQLSKLSLIGLS